jgi:hypothetical protein
MTIHLYGNLTRSVSPGDVVDVSGIFLPTPYTGIRALRAGLLQDTFLEAQHVKQMKKSYNEMEMTDKIKADLENLQQEENLYHRLALRQVLLSPSLFSFLPLTSCHQHRPRDLRPRGRQKGPASPPHRRSHQGRRRRHEDSWRHQHLPDGRPGSRQVAIAQVHFQGCPARRLYDWKGVLWRRSHRGRHARPSYRRVCARSVSPLPVELAR